MAIIYDISATTDCLPSAGLVSLSYERSPLSTGAESSAKTWRLTGPGGYNVQRPATPGLVTDFQVPADGDYLAQLSSATTDWGSTIVTISCGLNTPPVLLLSSLSATGATASAGGSVTLTLDGGRAPLTATLVEANLSQAATSGQPLTFPNLPPRTYTVRGKDDSGQTVEQQIVVAPYTPAVVMGCTDPAATNYDPQATQDNGSCAYAPPVRIPYFKVPQFQSLRFVDPTGPAFDNTLLLDEAPLDYEVRGYCQQVEQVDKLTVQILSNYGNAPTFELYPQGGGAAVLNLPATRVQQGAGITPSFDVYLQADPTAGRTRVYFNDDVLPLPFAIGDRVTISSTGTGLDGTYPVQQVLEDATAGAPYLLLYRPYSAAGRTDGVLTTTYQTQAFDTWQVLVDFANVPFGCYQAVVNATDSAFVSAYAASEPLDVNAHPQSLVVRWRNFDNAFGLNYSHGLRNQLRVTGRFFERQPQTEKAVLRNDDGNLELLTGALYRKTPLRVLQAPAWLHEVLACAFCHDFVRVGTERVIAEGEYTYTPVDRFTLGAGEVLCERRALDAGNRDDLGDVDTGGGPFLLANERYLLARK